MTDRERVRLAVIVGVAGVAMGVPGFLVEGSGGLVGAVGVALFVFGIVGVGQAIMIAVGHLTPGSGEARRGHRRK